VGRTLLDLMRLWVDLVWRREHLRPRPDGVTGTPSRADGK
jgi:hypothetical protein